MTTLSLLDLVHVREGKTPADALADALLVVQRAEQLNYRRYWVAEHHNMIGISSAATSVVIGHLAAGTSKIRVGSGGIMLPNHSPLQIAEQFGTLESLFPGRIDLGLGRAPGTDQITARAMRARSTRRGRELSRKTCRNCKCCSTTRRPTRPSWPYPEPVSKYRSGCWVPASSALN